MTKHTKTHQQIRLYIEVYNQINYRATTLLMSVTWRCGATWRALKRAVLKPKTDSC